MNPGIRGLPTQFSQMPQGLLGAPTPIPMPDQYWHYEAIDWANRASANGGTISTTVLRAVSDFCAAADLGQFRSAIYRLNLFAGGNLSGCLVPLYRGPTFGGATFGNSRDTNVNFVSGDYSETGAIGGLKGNGTNKYLNTGLALNAFPSVTSIHQSASATSASTGGNFIFSGTRNIVTAESFVLDEFTQASNGRAYRCGTGTVGQFPVVTSPGATEAHFIGNRESSTSVTLYRNGVSVATNATSITTTAHAIPFTVFACNGPSSGVIGLSASRMRMYSIGTSVRAAQAAAFSAAVIAFNTALGR
jgi:hypothetical protein